MTKELPLTIDDDGLKARLVRAFYDLAEQAAQQQTGACALPDLRAADELRRITSLLRDSTDADANNLLQALDAAETYLASLATTADR